MIRRAAELLNGALIAALAVASLVYGLRRVWPFTIDDAGIVYAYATHLAHGLGPRAVVGGPIVEGYSDFLWVAILAVVAKLGFALPAASKILGALLLGLACFAAARFLRLGRPLHPLSRWAEALPAVFLGLCSEFVVWAPSGLENALFWALLLVLAWLDGEEAEEPERFPASALAGVGLCLTRPEGIVYAGIVFSAKALHAAVSRPHRRQLARFAALFLGPLLVYQVVHFAVFRELVPNTYFAKAPGQGAMQKGVKYVKEGLEKNHVYALVPLALVGASSGVRRSLPLLLSAVAALAFAVYSRGDWMPNHRFVSLALPPIATLAAAGVLVVSNGLARISRQRLVGGAITTIFALVLAYRWYSVQAPRFRGDDLVWCHFCDRVTDADEHRKLLGAAGVRSGSFLTNDFGGPSLSSSPSFFPLDLLGLCDQRFADLEYRFRKGGFTGYDSARRDAAFHEQEAYPTLLFFGPNFWRTLGMAPETRFGYFDVHLLRYGRRDFIPTKMHRGAFVDYFPAVDSFRFEALDDRFVLVGAGAYETRPAGDIEVVLSLVQTKPMTERATFMVRTGTLQGPPVPLFGKMPELGASFGRGEPLLVRLGVRPPAGAPPDGMLELGVRRGEGPWSFRPLLSRGAVRSSSARPPPLPFPTALPGTSDASLQKLDERLSRLLRDRRTRADYTLVDPGLGEELRNAGKAAEARGARRDAYLAYVMATQADRDLIRDLHRPLSRLRAEHHDGTYALGLTLLQRFYSTGEPYWQAALIEHFARAERWREAAYFMSLWNETAPGVSPSWAPAIAKLREATAQRDARVLGSYTLLTPLPIPELESDFETGVSGWQVQGKSFHAADAEGARLFDGYQGTSFLTSAGPRGAEGIEVGKAESAELTVSGRALSFLVAGGGATSTVELVVDGQPREHAAAPRSRTFFPVLWDLRPYKGKRALLRVTDAARDTEGFIAVDELRIWPDP